MIKNVLDLINAYNGILGTIQNALPAETKFSQQELETRLVFAPPFYTNDYALLQDVACRMQVAYQILMDDMTSVHNVTLRRGFVKANQVVPTVGRAELIGRMQGHMRNIVDEILWMERQCAPQNRVVESPPELFRSKPPAVLENTRKDIRAQVYLPEAVNNQDFRVKAEPDVEEVANRIAKELKIKVHNDEIYYYADEPKRYRKLTGKEPQVLIDAYVKSNGLKVKPANYDEIRRCLLYDCRIRIWEIHDLPPFWWTFADGLVDIRNGSYIENPEEFFYTSAMTCPYIPSAQCPEFDRFLMGVAGGDSRIIEVIWRIIGYILSNDTSWKAFFVFLGVKDTGKSLLAKVIASFLEKDAVVSLGISEFGARFTTSELVDKRLTLCMDLTDEPISPVAVGKIKEITGGDLTRAEEKGKKGRSVHINAKLLFGTNHTLRTKQSDPAFAERQVLIPFLHPIPKEAQNRNLYAVLEQEGAGIAAKAAEAYRRLVADNYRIPEIDVTVPEGMVIDDAKVIQKFAEECCDFSDPAAKIATEKLFHAYEEFCRNNCVQPLEKAKFSERFNCANTTVEKKKIKVDGISLQGYCGVSLK